MSINKFFANDNKLPCDQGGFQSAHSRKQTFGTDEVGWFGVSTLAAAPLKYYITNI